jgi:hypothetical protein
MTETKQPSAERDTSQSFRGKTDTGAKDNSSQFSVWDGPPWHFDPDLTEWYPQRKKSVIDKFDSFKPVRKVIEAISQMVKRIKRFNKTSIKYRGKRFRKIGWAAKREGLHRFSYELKRGDLHIHLTESYEENTYPTKEQSWLMIDVPSIKVEYSEHLTLCYLWSCLGLAGDVNWLSDGILAMTDEEREAFVDRILGCAQEAISIFHKGRLDKHYWRVWDRHEIAQLEDVHLKGPNSKAYR